MPVEHPYAYGGWRRKLRARSATTQARTFVGSSSYHKLALTRASAHESSSDTSPSSPLASLSEGVKRHGEGKVPVSPRRLLVERGPACPHSTHVGHADSLGKAASTFLTSRVTSPRLTPAICQSFARLGSGERSRLRCYVESLGTPVGPYLRTRIPENGHERTN